jgi:hypothetical protein
LPESKYRNWRGIAVFEIQTVVYHKKCYLCRKLLKRMTMKNVSNGITESALYWQNDLHRSMRMCGV